jgi:hypothetical protein
MKKDEIDFNRFSQKIARFMPHASRRQLQSSRLHDHSMKTHNKQYQVIVLSYLAIRSIMCKQQAMLAKQRKRSLSIRAENSNYVGGISRLEL